MSTTSSPLSPTPLDIRIQLKLILGTDDFSKSKRLSRFLDLVVNSALEGKELDGKLIFSVIFSNRNLTANSSHVQVAAKAVRKALDKYYRGEGREAPVLMTLLSGKVGYGMAFSYKTDAGLSHLLHQAVASIRRPMSLRDVHEAEGRIQESILWALRSDLTTFLPRINAIQAELALKKALFVPSVSSEDEMYQAYGSAGFALNGIPKHIVPLLTPGWDSELAQSPHLSGLNEDGPFNHGDPNLASPYIVMGAFECCRFKWNAARSYFEKALAVDRLATTLDPYYAAFLAVTGEMGRALINAEARLRAYPEDPFAGLFLMLLRYVNRQDPFTNFSYYRHGMRHLRYQNVWLEYLLEGCVLLGPRLGVSADRTTLVDSYTLAMSKIQTAADLFQDKDQLFSGLFALAVCRKFQASSKSNAADRQLLEHAVTLVFSQDHVSPFQAALCHMGLGQHSKAIQALHRAIDCINPLMVWLPLWPLLEPLWSHPEFDSLLDRMNLREVESWPI